MASLLFNGRLVGAVSVLLTLQGLNTLQSKSWSGLTVGDACLRLVLSAAAYLVVPVAAWRAAYAWQSRRCGCGAPRWYPHRDPVLGLDWFGALLAAMRSHSLLAVFADRFAAVGHTYLVNVLGAPMVMTDEPDNVKAVLSARFADWPLAGARLTATLAVLGPHSIFSANGATWQKARAMLRPSFVRDQVSDLQCLDRHIGNMVRKIPIDGKVFDLQDLLYRMTTDSSTDFLLGKSLDLLNNASAEDARFASDFEYALTSSTRRQRLGWLTKLYPDGRFGSAVRYIRAYVDKYVLQAKLHPVGGNVGNGGSNGNGKPSSSSLVRDDEQAPAAEARKYVFLDEMIRSGASEEYVRDQVLSVMLAGRDTTASALTSLFYELARHPDVVKKIRAEMAQLGAQDPGWEELKGLKYLANVIKESLRLHSTVPTMSRGALADTILPVGGGPDGKAPVFVPKGTVVRWSSWTMQRRKDLYGEDAEEFRPERWDELRVGWEYIPFSGGPRICIGQQFALTQLLFTVFRFFQAFSAIEFKDDRPMLQKLAISPSLLHGCLISATPA